jgi:hypothetical protein
MYTAMSEESLVYDSSMTDLYGQGLSNPTSGLTWPYTFDYGTPQSCNSGLCPINSHEGIWELPLNCLHNADNTLFSGMDPQTSGDDLLTLLTRNFDQHYNTNRSPFGLFVHAATWLAANASRVTAIEQFFQYAVSKPNVFFATSSQVIRWMQNPVPASEVPSMSEMFCPMPPTTSSSEICNGIDDNQNLLVDEGVVNTCSYPSNNFQTCAPCPKNYPDLNSTLVGYLGLCGDSVCQSSETCASCPLDCVCPNSSAALNSSTPSITSTSSSTSSTSNPSTTSFHSSESSSTTSPFKIIESKNNVSSSTPIEKSPISSSALETHSLFLLAISLIALHSFL